VTTTDQQAGKGPTKQLETALHAHFIRPEDRLSPAGTGAIYLTEVTAPDSSRRADVVHIGLWKNRGAGRIDVCELKTSRSDFLREIADPAKAEAWWPYSTTFSLVVPHLSIASPAELPEGWGLLVPSSRGRRFKEVVKPAVREPRLTVGLLLTLLKNTETTRTNALQHLRQDLNAQHTEQVRKLRRDLAGTSDPDVKKRLALLDQLETAMGIPLIEFSFLGDGIEPGTAAAGLKEYMASRAAVARAQGELQYRADDLERIAAALSSEAKQLRKTLDTITPKEC